MEKEYKIEMKPTYWEVSLRAGEYSDKHEEHLFFAGNDENEIWNFVKRYVKSLNSIYYRTLFYDEDKEPILTNKDDDWRWSEDYYVTIKRLNIIYFQK